MEELQAKGMDSVLLVIVEIRKLFASSSALTSLRVTVPQHSPARSVETAALAGGEDGFVEDPS